MHVYRTIPYKTVTFSEEKRQKNQICFFRFFLQTEEQWIE